ncbi:hypothetical protein EV193_104361 [Herbihabitans rhizosphaerae]|uniref:Uncharacterized protein n=1 Tax=Herbihabitans rhizosphaerae TaxID=1872711 RepID=A0A4Q7KRG6_9PSEU|nr:hypothetical protein EV193_104361 [Herbihabitans rhizosphaerae]
MRLISPAGTRVEVGDEFGRELLARGYVSAEPAPEPDPVPKPARGRRKAAPNGNSNTG